MSFLRQIVGLIASLLLSVLGAVAMPMAPTLPYQAEFFPHQQPVISEHTNVHFAARAPPSVSTNVALAGVAVAEHGNGIIMHRHETHVASFGFVADFNAPNRTLTQIDTPIDLTNGRSGHILANHRAGAGKTGKTEFPSNWDDQRIVHQVSDISTDPSLVRQFDSRGTPYVVGTRDGVEIRVNFFPDNHARAGQISTAYPTR